MSITIKTKLDPMQAAAIAKRYLPAMAGEVMNQTILSFRQGKNVKGKKLHVPKRLKGGSGSSLGLKEIVKASKSGARGLGGPGIDTGKLISQLVARKWMVLSGKSVLVDPSISMSISYYEAYKNKYAGGSISGLNPKIVRRISTILKKALTRGS